MHRIKGIITQQIGIIQVKDLQKDDGRVQKSGNDDSATRTE
jgi:hypothetical protein